MSIRNRLLELAMKGFDKLCGDDPYYSFREEEIEFLLRLTNSTCKFANNNKPSRITSGQPLSLAELRGFVYVCELILDRYSSDIQVHFSFPMAYSLVGERLKFTNTTINSAKEKLGMS